VFTSSNANAPWQNRLVPNIGAGFIYYHNFKNRRGSKLFHLGASLNNFIQPNNSLLLGNNLLMARATFHTGCIFPFKNNFGDLIFNGIPYLRFTMDDPFNFTNSMNINSLFEVGSIIQKDYFYGIIAFKRSFTTYRTVNSLVLIPTFYINQNFRPMKIGVGVDLNIGGFSAGNILTYEINISMPITNKRCRKKGPGICDYEKMNIRPLF
jgi:hypothetical protein